MNKVLKCLLLESLDDKSLSLQVVCASIVLIRRVTPTLVLSKHAEWLARLLMGAACLFICLIVHGMQGRQDAAGHYGSHCNA